MNLFIRSGLIAVFMLLLACAPDSQNTNPTVLVTGSDINVTTAEDNAVGGTIVATDPEGDELSYSIAESPSEGTATIDNNGQYNYTPNPDVNGSDSFVVAVNDAVSQTLQTVAVTITPVNDAPTASDTNQVAEADNETNAQLSATDIDNDSLTYRLGGDDVDNGTLTLNADGSYSYTPAAGFVGADSFNFIANDGTVDSNTATVTLNVVSFAGQSTDYVIASNEDGEDISFTVHEPDQLIPGQTYPLVLEGHGYGGSKVSASNRGSGRLYDLLAAGYGVLSIDQRGFGASGGTVRLFDPLFEGRDLIQLLDWAETNLDWVMYRDNNLVLGAIGGSYGGGYQHAVHALDPKKRIDALAPEITWHDLRYSLFSGNVFKSYWATLLSGGGNGQGNQDQQVNQGLAEGLSQNNLSQENLDLLYSHSFISHCESNNIYTHDVYDQFQEQQDLEPVPALYWQSTGDTLFNMNEMYDNVKCLRALGADVRALTKVNGHDGGSGHQCGELERQQSIHDWFDEKLKGETGKADYIPQNCFTLSGTDGVVTETLPEGEVGPFDIGTQSIVASSSSNQTNAILLTSAGADGAVLAGLPTVQLTVADSTPGATESGDPILFLGIGVRDAGGTGQPTLVMTNQVRPIRGYGEHNIELVGLNIRLEANQEVHLVIYAGFNSRYPNSGSTAPAPVTVTGTVSVPLLAHDLPAPPSNTGGAG